MAIREVNRPSLKRVSRREDKIGFMVAIFVRFKQVERKRRRLWPSLRSVDGGEKQRTGEDGRRHVYQEPVLLPLN
ncbi:hypothetical protein IGI04_015625 [Brassica rapa subsp. trilocularis]|uniref:Uncharacterized protein n=1 Tax=Brassica rapa subsp. trilocularis TaxID=1813537 RepID=A0ABQ7MQS4_BRACM|nr:hypothetical protein IGI04_015625 [Brassica rapa subsp. trilocularis]